NEKLCKDKKQKLGDKHEDKYTTLDPRHRLVHDHLLLQRIFFVYRGEYPTHFRYGPVVLAVWRWQRGRTAFTEFYRPEAGALNRIWHIGGACLAGAVAKADGVCRRLAVCNGVCDD